MRFRMGLGLGPHLVLPVLMLLVAEPAYAQCQSTTDAKIAAGPLNIAVLGAAATVLPESVRPNGFAFSLQTLKAVKAGRIADERGRERIVSSLVLASWFLHRAERDWDAAAALRRLADSLAVYDGADLSETRRDSAYDLFEVARLLAEYGDSDSARGILTHIGSHRADYERRVGVYPTARALVELNVLLGRPQTAREELEALAERMSATYSAPEDAAWAFIALVDTAVLAGLTEDAHRYFERGRRALDRIRDDVRRRSMEALYRRLQSVRTAVEEGTPRQDDNRTRLEAAELPFEERLSDAMAMASARARGEAFSRIVDSLTVAKDLGRAEKQHRLNETVARIDADKTLVADPLAALWVVESLMRAGRFGDAARLLKKTCGRPVPMAFRPMLAMAAAFVAAGKAVAIEDSLKSFGLGASIPLLATGLPQGPLGGNMRGDDPLPELSAK